MSQVYLVYWYDGNNFRVKFIETDKPESTDPEDFGETQGDINLVVGPIDPHTPVYLEGTLVDPEAMQP